MYRAPVGGSQVVGAGCGWPACTVRCAQVQDVRLSQPTDNRIGLYESSSDTSRDF